MRTTLLCAVALLCAVSTARASQHRNGDGSVSDDVLIQNGGQIVGPANPFPVGLPDLRATGVLAAATANAAYVVTLGSGQGVVGFRISGLTGSGATLVPEASNDGGLTWTIVNALVPGTPNLVQSLTSDQQLRLNAGGHTTLRLRISIAGTGTISVASTASLGDPLVALSAPLPAGGNLIGSVQTPIPANVVTCQVKIATTGTAVPLSGNAYVNGIATVSIPLQNGIVVKGKTSNVAVGSTGGTVGGVGVSNVTDGTGNGYFVEPGGAASFAAPNINLIYVNGIAGDIFTCEGN